MRYENAYDYEDGKRGLDLGRITHQERLKELLLAVMLTG
jgi:hypothetical protein